MDDSLGRKGVVMESGIPSEPVAEKPKGKRIIDPRSVSVPLFVLAAGLIVMLINGIRYGCAQDWMKMCLLLFGSFLNLLFGAFVLLARSLNDLSARIEVLDGRVQTNEPISALWVRIIVTVAVPVLLFVLAVLAGFREHWLAFGFHLAGCGTVVVLSFTVWAYVKIHDCLDRLWLRKTAMSQDSCRV
jgi:hypothetical protein